MPNIWATEADGRADATAEEWDPDDIWEFTTCGDGWWKLGTTDYIMEDGSHFDNGWGPAAERRINWFLDEFPDCAGVAETASIHEGRSFWMNLHVSGDEFFLLDESYVIGTSPNYLPGGNEFTINVFSNGGELLGKYAIEDPRRILAESDYNGPTWVDNMTFQVVVPYFASCGKLDLIESATGNVKFSVDVSHYATVFPPIVTMVSPPSGTELLGNVTFVANVTDESGVASVFFSIRRDNGDMGEPVGFENLAPTYSPDTGDATLTFDTGQLPGGDYLVVVSATDIDGNSTTIRVPYSIENWTVINLLPKSKKYKAGRTIPVKFSLRGSDASDHNQHFIYSEDLSIKIYATDNPNHILQISEFGEGSKSYRINEAAGHYITNFKTSKTPKTYMVEIWRKDKDFMLGSLTFKTVK
jgi:hypothetical protein